MRDHVLGPEAFAKVQAKVHLVPDDVPIIAEDGTGRTYNYGEEGFPDQEPDISARQWLGVEPVEAVRYVRFIDPIPSAMEPNTQ